MSESIDEPSVFFWFGMLRCPKVLKNLRFSCGLGGSDVRKYRKTLGLLWFGRLRCPKGSKNHRCFVVPCTLRNSSNAYSSKLGNFLVRGRPSSLGAFWRLWPAMLNIEKVGSPLWDRMQKKIADNYVTAFWDPPKHIGFDMDFFLRIDCGALYTRFLILWSCMGGLTSIL